MRNTFVALGIFEFKPSSIHKGSFEEELEVEDKNKKNDYEVDYISSRPGVVALSKLALPIMTKYSITHKTNVFANIRIQH